MLYERGKLVEFTDKYQWNYTLGDEKLARYGVIIEDSDGPIVKVETTNGIEKIQSNCIHAYAWAGWMPEEIEIIWEKYNPEVYDRDEDDYPF